MAHLHEMRDSDNHFIIDPVTMVITNGSAKHTLQQGDHNSEIYTFELPRLIEGHDMTLCNLVEIHYINIKGDKTEKSEDVHAVKDMAISDDPDTLVFTWTVHGNATMYAGSLNFRIRFGCTDENGAFTYRKHTEIFKGISISEGFDNAASVEKDHSDILSQWEARLDDLEATGGAGGACVVVSMDIEEVKANMTSNQIISHIENGNTVYFAYRGLLIPLSAIYIDESSGNHSAGFSTVVGENMISFVVDEQANVSISSCFIEITSNRTTTIDETADDEHYPTAKAVYDYVGNIETSLDAVISLQNSIIGGEFVPSTTAFESGDLE